MTSQLQDYRVQEYRLPSPPSFKCNVLRESLSGQSHNTKEKGVVGISLYICMMQGLVPTMDPNLAAAWGGWVMTPDGQMVRQPIGAYLTLDFLIS
jgi:hypothetical protein